MWKSCLAGKNKQRSWGFIVLGTKESTYSSSKHHVLCIDEPHLKCFLLLLFLFVIQSLVENIYYKCDVLWQSQILSTWHFCPSSFFWFLCNSSPRYCMVSKGFFVTHRRGNINQAWPIMVHYSRCGDWLIDRHGDRTRLIRNILNQRS